MGTGGFKTSDLIRRTYSHYVTFINTLQVSVSTQKINDGYQM
jgi:hypothetical protein